MSYDPLDPDSDIFRPPEISTLVFCLHCQEEYDSYRMEWRVMEDHEGKPHGFWCCPNPECDGKGFGFDLLPVDPEYRDERGGWCYSDDEESDEFADDLPDADGETDQTSGGADESDGEALPW